jgi:hypothetical protein
MRRSLLFLFLFFFVALVACSSSRSGFVTDAGADAALDEAKCSELQGHAEGALQAAQTTADRACEADGDCVLASLLLDCGGPRCSAVFVALSKSGANQAQADVAKENATRCTDYFNGHCPPLPTPPCPPPNPTLPTAFCSARQCTLVHPWVSFSFIEGSRNKTVTFEGQLTLTSPSKTLPIDDGDRAVADAILRSASFRANPSDGCGTTPSDAGVITFSAKLDTKDISLDATNCVLDAPDNAIKRLHDIVAKYD